jgi:monoamine oxidase
VKDILFYKRINVDYQIFEAIDRYGGRLKKNETLAGFPIDIGAEWIHNVPGILNKLKGKKGDVTDEVPIPYHLESAYSWDGKKYEKIPNKELDQRFDFFPEYKFKH